MEFIGNIEGYNYQPITGYNAFLKGNATLNQKVEIPNETEFDKILNLQTAKAEPAPDTAGGLMKQIERAVSSSLNDVNNKRLIADAAQEEFAMGGDVSVHDLMIAQEKASLSMQMALQTRNKLISAYTDIKNMAL
ncbi:flagellar hook-basal body complex protein FliE [bacterium]|nr:flagellar hook-basal body complex protein FliE [bacterium]